MSELLTKTINKALNQILTYSPDQSRAGFAWAGATTTFTDVFQRFLPVQVAPRNKIIKAIPGGKSPSKLYYNFV